MILRFFSGSFETRCNHLLLIRNHRVQISVGRLGDAQLHLRCPIFRNPASVCRASIMLTLPERCITDESQKDDQQGR